MHSALLILEPGQALGWSARERGTDLCPRTDRQEWHGYMNPCGRRGIQLGATSPVPGYRQVAAPVSGQKSATRSLGEYQLEQAPRQGTETCLGLGQGIHWAKFSGTNLSHHRLLRRRGTWRTTFLSQLPSVTSQGPSMCCEQPLRHPICALKTCSPFEIQEQLSMIRQH